METVTCRLCGLSLGAINNFHLYWKHNGLTVMEYWTMFPADDYLNKEGGALIAERKEGLTFTEEQKEKISKGCIETWKDLAHREERSNLIREGLSESPNLPERVILHLLEENFPGVWRFNKKGEVPSIGGRFPDFMRRDGIKQVLDFFGIYWHSEVDEAVRIQHFKEYGYQALVVWSNEFWGNGTDWFINRVKEFMKGGV